MQQRQSQWWVVLGIIPLMGCQAVKSSELKSTKAIDVALAGTIDEYTDSDTVKIQTQLQTADSGVGIEFSQGESLKAATDLVSGISASISLAYDKFLELDKYYSATVARTVSGGSYHVSYTDAENATTTVGIPTGSVAPITAPAVDSSITDANAVVTWDPALMPATGSIQLYLHASANGTAHSRWHYDVPNTGSYTCDTSGMTGTGRIELRHIDTHTTLAGFKKSNVQMRNIAKVNLTYNVAVAAKGGLKSLSATEQIDAAMHECLHFCETNEEAFVEIGDEKFSCCIE